MRQNDFNLNAQRSTLNFLRSHFGGCSLLEHGGHAAARRSSLSPPPEEIQRLRKAQLALLHQAAPRLRPGGVLVYSTCSLEPEENQDLVRQFLSEHAGLKLRSERELLPFIDEVDGAYVARLERMP